MDYEVKTAAGLSNLPDAAFIRETVFIKEQGFQNEFDDIDKTAVHAVLYVDNKPVATGRVFGEGEEYHIGRVAVLKELRGKDLGSVIIDTLEKEAWKLGGRRISLSAQVRAKGFYEKLGYKSLDDLHMDEFCPHVTMVKEKP